MKILAIKTDSNPSEIYLINEKSEVIKKKIWNAERSLAKEILMEISNLLENNFNEIDGIIVYEGPGSFTGLRIGVSVANAISYSENKKIAAVNGEKWIHEGVKKILDDDKNIDFNKKELPNNEKETGENGVIFAKKSELEMNFGLKIATPKYGGEAHITSPKK